MEAVPYEGHVRQVSWCMLTSCCQTTVLIRTQQTYDSLTIENRHKRDQAAERRSVCLTVEISLKAWRG